MGERVIYLGRINTCLVCGDNSYEVFLERDHAFPRSMVNKPDLGRIRSPFREVVYNRYNVFRMCHRHHWDVDNRKTLAFSSNGFITLDPVGLLIFLMEQYPLTENEKYRPTQIDNLLKTNARFMDAVRNLNGELPRDLVRKYHDAGEVALEFERRLQEKK